MVTLSDIKYEHLHAMDMVKHLTLKLNNTAMSNEERSEIIEKPIIGILLKTIY